MKPIFRITLILIISALACQICVNLINKGYRKYNVQYTELFTKATNYNVLFLGSSRILYHINPKIIDSICNVNSYNSGIDGANLFEFKILLEGYLEKHPAPKLLVLNLDLHSFENSYFFNHNQYYPYLSNIAIKRALTEKNYYHFIYKIFPFLIITEYDNLTRGNAINGLLGKDQSYMSNDDFQYKGYKSNGTNFIQTSDTLKRITNVNVTTQGIRFFQEILQVCKTNKIKLILTYAPEYNFQLQKHTTNSQKVLKFISEQATTNKMIFFRDDSLSISADPKAFANFGHLNREGAKQYSEIFAIRLNSLKNYLPF